MKIKAFLLVVLVLRPIIGFADSCQGKGTVFFYGNGMFNLHKVAKKSKRHFFKIVRQSISLDKTKDIKDDLAYKSFELIPIFNVMNQKRIDDFGDFWLWLNLLKESPPWFKDALLVNAALAFKDKEFSGFSESRTHFEQYAEYIRAGYNIVLTSHSQGNFYANRAMRKLSDYTDASLTGSISEKKSKHPLFPEFFDLFANIQVATPASETVNSSPWSTFQDDMIINFVRKTAGALPANLKTPGNIPPDGDWKGHDFIKAYLRNPEAKGKILSDIQTQYNKLKYPIAYFDQAVLLQSHWRHYGDGNDLHSPDAHLYFTIVSASNRDIGGADEKRPNQNEIIHQTFSYCNDLTLGTSKIYLSVDSDEKKEVSFEVWPEGKKEGVKPSLVSFPVKRGFSDWEVGTIATEKGLGKESLQVKVEIYPTPKPRRKKDVSL